MASDIAASVDRLLLTGASGHIGFSVLLESLKAGLTVRCALRSDSKVKEITSNKLIRAINPGDRLTTIIVPSITEPGAYDEACKDVSHVIHLATASATSHVVTTQEDFQLHILQPSILSTMGMLESARKSGTVKRIVLASSAAAIIDTPKYMMLPAEERAKILVTAQDRYEPTKGPFFGAFHAYSAAKAFALQAAENWVVKEKPTFDLIHTFPSFVNGGNPLWVSKKDPSIPLSSNMWVTRVALGTEEGEEPLFIPNASVHMDDVVRVHIGALSPAIVGNSSFLISVSSPDISDGHDWQDTVEIVKRRFPEAVEKGILPCKGKIGTLPIAVDGRETERTFGYTSKNFEEQVTDLIAFYLELPDGQS